MKANLKDFENLSWKKIISEHIIRTENSYFFSDDPTINLESLRYELISSLKDYKDSKDLSRSFNLAKRPLSKEIFEFEVARFKKFLKNLREDINYNIVNFQYNYEYFLNISYNQKEITAKNQDLRYYDLGEILFFDEALCYDFKNLFENFSKIIEYDDDLDLRDIPEIMDLEKWIYKNLWSIIKTAIVRHNNEKRLVTGVTFYLTEFSSMHYYLFKS